MLREGLNLSVTLHVDGDNVGRSISVVMRRNWGLWNMYFRILEHKVDDFSETDIALIVYITE